MILCPVCNSGGAVKVGDTYACMNCGHRWQAPPPSLTFTFPWPFGTILYAPQIHYGKAYEPDRKCLIGYEVNEKGVLAEVVDVNPHSVTERLKLNNLFATREEAMGSGREG